MTPALAPSRGHGRITARSHGRGPGWAAGLLALLAASLLGTASPARADAALDAELVALSEAWAVANYRTPRDQQLKALEAVEGRAAALVKRYPRAAEPLIWDGIVLSTIAGVKGGIGAMGPAKASKARFEAALAIDEKAMSGSGHTSLGVLYYKVPGFPIAFGSDKKARFHLDKALSIDPRAVDNNYFYAEFLYEQGEYAEALTYLDRARQAPLRPGRTVADEGRRRDIEALARKVKKKLG